MSIKSRILMAVTALGVAGLVAPAVADAPSSTAFQLEQFEPTPLMGTDLLNVSTSDVTPHLTPSVGLLFHYANSPFVLNQVALDGDTSLVDRLVEHSLKADLAVAMGLWERVAIGVVLPMALHQDGSDLAIFGRPGASVSGFAMGDARIFAKARLLDPEDFGGFGLHVSLPIYLPTGDKATFQSDGTVRARPTLGAEYRSGTDFTLALNVGYLFRPERPAYDYTSDHAVPFALGADVGTPVKDLRVIGTLSGSVNLGESRDPVALAAGQATPGDRGVDVPLEFLAGVRYHLDPDWSVQAGGGAGLTDDVGAPAFRVYGGVAYNPTTRDTDGDGLRDGEDSCVEIPEDKDGFQSEDGCPDPDNDGDAVPDVTDGKVEGGFGDCRDNPEDKDGFQDEDGCPDPDNDGDGLPDAGDACPNEPEDKDGFEDDNGCPDLDNDKDGVPDVTDGQVENGFGNCRDNPEDKDGFQDEDGCPDPDNDGDGLLDANDKCPDQPETKNEFEDEDGCPDTKQQNVKVTEDAIVILQKVFFAVDRDIIKKESYGILNEVATVLRENAWITSIRVDGHTDSDGNAAYNTDLSQRRAASVVRYLVDKGGVEASRLAAKGFGPSVPIADNKTKEGKAANRRVEFTITSVRGVEKAPKVQEQDNRPTTTE